MFRTGRYFQRLSLFFVANVRWQARLEFAPLSDRRKGATNPQMTIEVRSPPQHSQAGGLTVHPLFRKTVAA